MKNLENLRKQIDDIDQKIVSLLAKRMEIVKRVGKYKRENNLPIFDNARWQEVIKSKKGFVRKIWEIIHEEALKIESKANKTL